MDLVSIIVPVYNTSRYLRKCIDSLLNQSYENIEIILIDDGSVDTSPQICDEYAEKYEKIRCFHIKNNGVSNARNQGILNSRGKYIQFIDSDDYYTQDAVETMVEAISGDVELASAQFAIVREGVFEEIIGDDKDALISCEEFLEYTFSKTGGFYFGTTANKIYMADIIKDNNILFDVQVTLCEDLLFNLEYSKHVNNIQIKGCNIYNYEQGNIHSLIKKKRPRGEVWRCKSIIYKAYVDIFTSKNSYEQHKSKIANYLMENAVQQIKEIIEFDENGSNIKLLKDIKSFCNIDYVVQCANIADEKNRLVRLTSKYICKKRYFSLIMMYKAKSFIKNHMGCLHEVIKRNNEEE